MATWFAQNSGVNIDSVNQWNSAANGSGSWLTWASLGAADILVANGKTSITINVNVTCATITNAATGGTAGGTLLWSSAVTITANIDSNAATLLTASGSGDRTLVGNITTGSQVALSFGAAASLYVTGSVTGGTSGAARGIGMSSNQSVYMTGNCTGGTGNDSPAVYTASGTVVITGNMTASASSHAVQDQGAGVIVITGDITPSTGVQAVKTIGNTTIRHTGNLLNASTGVFGFGSTTVKYMVAPTGTLQHQYASHVAGVASTARSLYTGGVNLGQPSVANVRSGTVYGASSEYTGTLIVPSPTLVAIGVSTDNTVGSYNPSVNASDIRSAVGLAAANLDTQLSGISSKTTNLPSDPADQSLVEAAITSGINTVSTLIDSLPTNAELTTALAAADDAVLAAIAALNNLSAAQVNAEVLDVLNTDTFNELASPPAASSTLAAKLTWLFMWAKNKATETATQRKLYADNSTTVVSTETVSDDGTTFTKGKAS